jgi:hypothetical protein
VHLLVLVHILLELDGRQHALAAEFVEFVMSGVENEVLLLNWHFLASIGDDKLKFLLVVALVKVDQGREVIEIP